MKYNLENGMFKYFRSLFGSSNGAGSTTGVRSVTKSLGYGATTPSEHHIAMVLDRSGSMAGTEEKTVTAVNGFLGQMQADSLGKGAMFTLMTFDSQGFDVIRRGAMSEVRHLEVKEFTPRGATPLYDAVGDTIGTMTGVKKNMLVILTDGLENASKKFTEAGLCALIEEKRAAGWIIIYLGANIDAWRQAERIGVPKSKAMNFSQRATSVPSQPGNPGLWNRFTGSVAQNPMGYALGTAALLGLAYLAFRSGDARAEESLGFTDADRNAAMGMNGVGDDTWEHAVEHEVATFDEPVKTDSIFDPGLSPDAAQSAAELPPDFDPSQGSMKGGEQAIDHGGEILSPASVPSSDDFVPRDEGVREEPAEVGAGSSERSFRPDPEPSRYESPAREMPDSVPSRSYEAPAPSGGGWGSSGSDGGGSSYDSGGSSFDGGGSSFD